MIPGLVLIASYIFSTVSPVTGVSPFTRPISVSTKERVVTPMRSRFFRAQAEAYPSMVKHSSAPFAVYT